MATITGSATGSNASKISVWIAVAETNIDTQNNRSYVTADFYTQVKSGQTSSTYDNQGHVHFDVNGGRVKDANMSIDYRNANLNHLAHWEGWVGHDGAGNASISFSGSFSLDSSYVSGGSASGSVGLSMIWSGATPPSRLDATPSIYETGIDLAWYGYGGGVNNAITRFEVHYSVNDGSGWSGEYAFGTGGANSAYIDTTGWPRGRRFNYHVRCITVKGDNPESGWNDLENIKNRAPGAPGAPAPNKTIYKAGDTISLTFTAGSDADGNLAGYEIKMQDENGVDYNGGAIMASGAGTTLTINTNGWTPGKKWKFCSRSYDAFEIRSGWSAAGAVIQMGIAMKAITAPNTIKDMGDCYVVIDTGGVKSLKALGEAYEVVNGALKALA